ncbi:MAG: DUF2142 domain-containing protein [Lachnospiraceae bacterium]|nr:DUF2142 domain-containing protein [Lachnospiraceae bacterium]
MKDKIRTCNWFKIFFFMLGILYLFVLPPFTAPDEAGHFATAYHYANVLCRGADPVVESTAGNVYRQIVMREQDAALYGQSAACGEKESYSVLTAFMKETPLFAIENELSVRCLCRTMPYIFPLYIPTITAVLICRFMGIGSVIMVYFARFLTFLTAWYISCKAIERIPAGKKLFQVIVLFPMALHLFSSCSADAIANAAAVYGSAVILDYRQNPVKLRLTDGMTLAVALTVVTLSKPFYILFFVMGFLMPLESFGKKGYYYLFCILPLICWVWKYFPIIFSCFSEGDVSAYADLSQGYAIGYILGHPAQTVRLLVHSIWKELPYICAQSIGLYLGPLTFRIPSAAVAVFAGLLLSAVLCDGEQVFSGKLRLAVMFLFVFTYICCYCMDLLWWTPFGADTIEGVQGRYLLPLLGMLCVALKPVGQVKWKCLEIQSHVILGTAVLTHITVLLAVFDRLVCWSE